MPWLVCYYRDGGFSREWVDDEFSDEELFLTMELRGATYCEIVDDDFFEPWGEEDDYVLYEICGDEKGDQ